MNKVLLTLAASVIFFSSSAFGETSVYYEFSAINSSTRFQLKDVTIHITTIDLKLNKESQSQCTTDAEGKCYVYANISGGWFAGYSTKSKVSFSVPEGYSENVKYTSKSDGLNYYIDAMLISLEQEKEIQAQKKREEQEAAENAERERRDAEMKLERERREAELRQERLVKNLLVLKKSEEEAVFSCAKKNICEKAFALTEIFISTNSNMKIQVATSNTLETFTPTKTFDVGMKAQKIPKKGESSQIKLSAFCKEDDVDKYGSSEICTNLLIGVYSKFHSYLSSSMQ